MKGLLFCLVSAIFAFQSAEGFCPRFWIRRGRSQYCYRFLEMQLGRTWPNADISCRSVNSTLVQIESAEEKEWLDEQINNRVEPDNTRRWWTGLQKVNGQWKWSDGSDVDLSYISWAPNEPENGNNQRCGRWEPEGFTSKACSNKAGYICRRDITVPTPCPYGWEMYEDTCYRYKGDAMPYEDARSSCMRDGGDLVASRQIEVVRMVRDHSNYYQTDLWVGLRSSQVGGVTTWFWSDGVESTPQNTRWSDGQPQIENGYENNTCGMSLRQGSNGKLFSTSRCTESKSYVCQRPVGTCENGWRNHLGYCYKWVGYGTHVNAMNRCSRLGATMLTIRDQNEQDYINTILQDLSDRGMGFLWVGLSAMPNEEWKWSDGSLLSQQAYDNWAPGEPERSGNNRNCAIMFTSNKMGHWTTTGNCNQQRNFMCKIPEGVPVIQPTTTPIPYYCEDGWTLFSGKCHMINETEATWPLARKECQNKGGDLTVIKDDAMTDFILEFITRDAWIGLHKRNDLGNFTWLDENTISTYWNWAPGEPNNVNEEEDCVEVWNGRQTKGMWNDRRCGHTRSFMCSKNAYVQGITNPPSTTDQGWSDKCGYGWVDHVGTPHCYQFHTEYVSWQDARDTCSDYGGELLSLRNPEEQAFISARISTDDHVGYWIGINDRGDSGKWAWSDGSPLPYFNWQEGQPNNNDNKHCGVYLSTPHAWALRQCTGRYGYICRKPGMNLGTTTPPVSITPRPGTEFRCRKAGTDAWVEFNGNCYLFEEMQAITWSDARLRCQRRHADLVSITSPEENDFILATAAEEFGTDGQVWTGLEDLYGRHLYSWSDRSNVVYTNWARNEPNNYRGRKEECVAFILENGHWNDMVCTNTVNYLKGFVCKKQQEAMGTTTLPPSPTTPRPPTGCPQGTQWLYRGLCVWKNTKSRSFDDANTECQNWAEGASLISVLDQYTQAFISNRLDDNTGQHWIGFTNKGNNDLRWEWVNGDVSQTDYTHWDVGFTGNEYNRCAFMRTAPNYKGLWKTATCGNKYKSVCAVTKRGYTTPVPTDPPGPCLEGWLNRNRWCYKLGFPGMEASLRLPWSDALHQCRLLDAELVSIHNPDERDFIVQNLGGERNKYWIGLHNNSGEEIWSDGTGLGFTSWKGGQPDSHLERENCVTMDMGDGGDWEYQSCNVAMNWVCKRGRGRPAPTGIVPVPTEVPCGADSFVLKNAASDSVSSSCQAVSAVVAANLQDCKSKTCLLGGNTFNYRANTRVCDVRKCFGGDIELIDSTNNEDVYTINGPSCDEPGWKLYGDFCWYVSPETGDHGQVSFYEAHDRCAEVGGRLASIHGDEDNAIVTQLTSRTNHLMLWIGLNRLDLGSWKWSDQTPVDYINWARGEPNDHHYGQLCVNFYSYNGFWNDDNCADPAAYICKKRKGDVTPPTTPPTSLVPGYCPPEFYGINNKCFKVFGRDDYNERTTWQEAVDKCRALGQWYDLASISNKDEQALVNVLLDGIQTNTWIGMNTRVGNKKQWVDNSPITYENWAPGEPNGYRLCVEAYYGERLGEWNDHGCENIRAYLCQFRKHMEGVVSSTINPFPEQCEKDGYQNYQGECYKPLTTRTTWSSARQTCQDDGGELVSIHSVQENSFVQYFMKDPDFSPHWIGLNDIEETGSFVWSNNWFVTFTRWGAGQPVVDVTKRCTAFHSDGTWSVESCDTSMAAICKLITHPAPTRPPPRPGRCRDGLWSPFDRHCYISETNLADTMPNGELECGHRGGQLVSIHSELENFYIRGKLISDGVDRNIWIGLIRPQGNVEGWRWTDGTPVEYFHWAPGEPSDSTGEEENCVEMYADSGLWNDVRCYNSLRWMCKTEKELYTTIGTTVEPVGSSTRGQGSSVVPPGSTTAPVPGTPSRTTIPGGGTPAPSVGAPGGGSSLSGGGIAGVVIGVIAIVLILLLAGLVYLRRRNQVPEQLATVIHSSGISNILYFGTDNKASTNPDA